MPGRLRPAVLVWAAVVACGAAGTSTGDLVATVRAALRAGHPDKEIARLIRRLPLTTRLDEPVLEALESDGAGPAAVEELIRLRELTRELPPGRVPHLFDVPPAPPSAELSRAVETARAAALEYHDKLPDFLCTQTVRRYTDPRRKESWSTVDVLTIGVTYSGKGEDYKLIAVNHKPARRTLDEVGGTQSEGEFGSLLHRVFLPESEAGFQWERWGMVRRRLVHVFTYRIDGRLSHYAMDYVFDGKPYHLTTAMRGRVYIDRETGQTLRITWEADGLPRDSPIVRTPAVLDYDYADIGGSKFLLPLRADSRVVTINGQTRNLIEFSDYRKFSSEATVSFEK